MPAAWLIVPPIDLPWRRAAAAAAAAAAARGARRAARAHSILPPRARVRDTMVVMARGRPRGGARLLGQRCRRGWRSLDG
jgi:hypothetical protein